VGHLPVDGFGDGMAQIAIELLAELYCQHKSASSTFTTV